MKLPYHEGTLFAIPLRKGGFATGIVARTSSKGKVILCYFFGPRRISIPALAQIGSLKPGKAVLVARVGDLSLMEGEWPIIGAIASWERSDWPTPIFIRREAFSNKAWRVYYSDTNPNMVVKEEPANSSDSFLMEDGMFGSGAAEIQLTMLLTKIKAESGRQFPKSSV